MKIAKDCLVELAYTITDADGEVVESSDDGETLEYVQGNDGLPAALEEALAGKAEGDEVQVTLGPGEAFAEYSPEGIVSVPRGEFPPDAELTPGEWITVCVEGPDEGDTEGQGKLEMRVVEVDSEAVVLDANHPLANEQVTFRLKVLKVSAAE